MKIQEATVKNFRRIRMVEMKPEANYLVICGENAQGKTSLIDAICSGLSGTKSKAKMPVRKGEDKAEINITLDNGVTIRQYYTAEGGYGLVVKGPDGAKYEAGQSFLSQFYSSMQFDPLAFLRQDSKKQVEQLRKLVGLDFTAMDVERDQAYRDRTTVNKQLAEMKAKFSNFGPEIDSAPDVEVSISALSSQLVEANKTNAAIDGIASELAQHDKAIEYYEQEIARARAQIKSLQDGIDAKNVDIRTSKEAIDDLQKQAAQSVRIDTDAINKQIADAEGINQRVRLKLARNEARAEWKKVSDKAEALTNQIKTIDESKEKLLSNTTFPVQGLSLGEEGVTLNGVPLDEASAAEQLRTCFYIAKAMNPKMEVMLIRDGSLLDESNRNTLKEIAEQENIQILLEVVGEGGAESITIEDGMVKGS